MITAEEALKIIQQSWPQHQSQSINLKDVGGLILAEDISCDRDYPAGNKSIMDGIAINKTGYDDGCRAFKIALTQPAGKAQTKLTDPAHCVEIMTGALIPDGCDCVIPVEEITIKDGAALLKDEMVLEKCQYIKKQGEDAAAHEKILTKGMVLTAPRIAFCAAVGKSQVSVYPIIKIAVVSTGDEIVDLHTKPAAHQIRSSNDHFIKAILEKTGRAKCDCFHIIDNQKLLEEKVRELLSQYDILVFSGGVSMGKFDLIPQVLKNLKVKELFHKVAQKPGKPLWYGVSANQKAVFGLPGNPVSTYTCGVRFIREMLFPTFPQSYAKSKTAFECPGAITKYMMIKHEVIEGELYFEVILFKGSGDLISITQADGFVEVAPDLISIEKNQVLPIFVW